MLSSDALYCVSFTGLSIARLVVALSVLQLYGAVLAGRCLLSCPPKCSDPQQQKYGALWSLCRIGSYASLDATGAERVLVKKESTAALMRKQQARQQSSLASVFETDLAL